LKQVIQLELHDRYLLFERSEAKRRARGPFKPFGFRHSKTSERVTANLPAQRIGASDLVAVSVYDVPELTRTVRVGADGLIRLPMLKRRIEAEGLMPAELDGDCVRAAGRGTHRGPFRHGQQRRI
jgi:polysaccharide export outer membrane protein